MELFVKRIVNDLKPFQGLSLFSECKFSPLQGRTYFAATANGVLKIFHQNLWKAPVKELIFLNFRKEFTALQKMR